jgi:phosphomannomutase/phosphoglucomutase
MARIFSILAVLAVTLIILVGGGVYLFSKTQITQAHENAGNNLAKGVAYRISGHINVLSQILDQMAENPALIAAVRAENKSAMQALAIEMENYLPGAMIVRVLLPELADLDKTNIPHMGFADLDLVKETPNKHQAAVIQGSGEHRHLAIARQIKRRGRVIGVILASLQYDFLNKIINDAETDQGLITLNQGKIVIQTQGNKGLMNSTSANTIEIPGTTWLLQYWDSDDAKFGDLSIIGATIAIPALLLSLAFVFGFRRILEMLREDQSSVVKVVKDLMTNKPLGNYPVSLNEMRASISTLVQFKRVMENEDTESEDTEDDGLSSFFDDSRDLDDMSFLQESKELAGIGEIEGIEVFGTFKETKSATVEQFLEPVEQIEPAEQSVPEIVNEPEPVPATIDHAATIFRANDIRGEAGKVLSNDMAYDIGRAIGSEVKEKNCQSIVIARDGRLSSPELADSLVKGLVSTGTNVLDLGIAPTPVLYFVAHHNEGRCGVMITGSHNPPKDNGVKIVIAGETLSGEKIQKLKQRIDNEDYVSGVEGTVDQNNMFINEYIGMIAEDIKIARPMKIVLDCGNGVAGELGPTLLRTIGCEVIELYCDIDGNFPNHHPDPSKPENLEDLAKAVQENQADVGIAFDGDGDRLGIVDSKGKIIWPDRQMMVFAKNVLERKPGSEIIYDVKCTRHLDEEIRKYGGRPTMWKTGHSFMKTKIKATGAKLAGEMSGHIFFNDRWFGFDDALYAAARMIEILAEDTRNSNEVFADFPDSINTPELLVPLSDGEKFDFVAEMLKKANFTDGKVTDIDGLRVDFSEGWGLVRASNTTPSLMVRFEAETEAALRKIQDQFKEVMLQIKPDLNLPF